MRTYSVSVSSSGQSLDSSTSITHLHPSASATSKHYSKFKMGLKGRFKGICRVARRRLPILTWLPKYKPRYLIGDIIAGITVGLTAIPQAMAYAVLAGLRPEYGLYSSFIAPMVYVVLGSCRQVAAGPESLISLLSFETCGQDFPECVILAGFYSGLIELIFGLLRLGPIVSLISEPVAIGFTAGAAVTTSSSQVKSILGLNGPKGTEFWSYWESIIVDTWHINAGDAVLGLSCAVILVLIQNLDRLLKTKKKGVLGRVVWGLTVSRNVIVVVGSSLLAYLWVEPPFKLTGHVPSGVPPFRPPLFFLPKESESSTGNSTGGGDSTDSFTFFETWEELSTGPLFIAIISILNNVAISKAFAKGQSVNGTQEMIALGAANVIGSFFRAQPTSGSFSRSAVNDASGVKTPLGGLITGLLVLLTLSFLTPACYYIPKASLSAVIICAVLPMIKFRAVLVMWKISRLDVLTCFLTFFSCTLLGVEAGIGMGVFVSVVILLRESLSDRLMGETRVVEGAVDYVLLKPRYGLNFPGVDTVRRSVRRCIAGLNETGQNETITRLIAIECGKCSTLDYSAAIALVELGRTVRKQGYSLILLNAGEEWEGALRAGGNSSSRVPLLNSTDVDFQVHLKKAQGIIHSQITIPV